MNEGYTDEVRDGIQRLTDQLKESPKSASLFVSQQVEQTITSTPITHSTVADEEAFMSTIEDPEPILPSVTSQQTNSGSFESTYNSSSFVNPYSSTLVNETNEPLLQATPSTNAREETVFSLNADWEREFREKENELQFLMLLNTDWERKFRETENENEYLKSLIREKENDIESLKSLNARLERKYKEKEDELKLQKLTCNQMKKNDLKTISKLQKQNSDLENKTKQANDREKRAILINNKLKANNTEIEKQLKKAKASDCEEKLKKKNEIITFYRDKANNTYGDLRNLQRKNERNKPKQEKQSHEFAMVCQKLAALSDVHAQQASMVRNLITNGCPPLLPAFENLNEQNDAILMGKYYQADNVFNEKTKQTTSTSRPITEIKNDAIREPLSDVTNQVNPRKRQRS
ncbi:unnamed protein product [Ambrosiozyma monospora]|uniref:Unnamed protein product n=1 Tax=Ambrosiozyma monospora TaxID=43982 RepID=A0ACB5T1I8_AMBMO|nr:unnamed protein product [Ambrosiozyma monospora]